MGSRRPGLPRHSTGADSLALHGQLHSAAWAGQPRHAMLLLLVQTAQQACCWTCTNSNCAVLLQAQGAPARGHSAPEAAGPAHGRVPAGAAAPSRGRQHHRSSSHGGTVPWAGGRCQQLSPRHQRPPWRPTSPPQHLLRGGTLHPLPGLWSNRMGRRCSLPLPPARHRGRTPHGDSRLRVLVSKRGAAQQRPAHRTDAKEHGQGILTAGPRAQVACIAAQLRASEARHR